MSSIKTFQFNEGGFEGIKEYHFGQNWPVVYVLENEMYIGEKGVRYHLGEVATKFQKLPF